MFELQYRVLAERTGYSMVEFVTHMAAVILIAVAAVTSIVAALAAQRKERSRVLVPIPVRLRNGRR